MLLKGVTTEESNASNLKHFRKKKTGHSLSQREDCIILRLTSGNLKLALRNVKAAVRQYHCYREV